MTPKILDVLKAKELPTTFFVIVRRWETRPLLEQQIREGARHRIHSIVMITIASFGQGSRCQSSSQVKETQASMREVLGRISYGRLALSGGHMSEGDRGTGCLP